MKNIRCVLVFIITVFFVCTLPATHSGQIANAAWSDLSKAWRKSNPPASPPVRSRSTGNASLQNPRFVTNDARYQNSTSKLSGNQKRYPSNANEKAAWEKAINTRGDAKDLPIKNRDPRFPNEEGWQKSYIDINDNGKTFHFHFQYLRKNDIYADFKLVNIK